jgi:hypothetical protein
MPENKELDTFRADLIENINSGLLSVEEGANPDQLFTEYALTLLADAGETENYRVCYDEKPNKRGGIEHKINAYALYENYETLDLFVTIYNIENTIQAIAKNDAEKAFIRLERFFKNSISNGYVNALEESAEIFDLAHTLGKVPEIKEYLTRINLFLITNSEVKAVLKNAGKIENYSVFYRVIDINYLFNLSDKNRIPIEIEFEANGISVPCIENSTLNNDYQSYLAILPGSILCEIYEQYGPRLLEQNVRSFLQFTGKINKGIRKTILEEPHMFLAFNNGIAATAEEIKIIDLPDNKGKGIGYVKDLQIVNGGQTTASIYHTWKKNNADISKIFVPLKLTIIRDKANFADTVGRIAEYANTQNKVSAADLSSNRENHVSLEKLSRTLWAPPKVGESHQTRWFYERTRGQYKNERLRFGITPSRKILFDKQNPKSQMFTKEELAKYINSYREINIGKKALVGPHIVTRGSQKNYAQFLSYNFDTKLDNIYFEDAIALAILFKTSEKVYGVSPNAIGDMRYITLPYTIAWLGVHVSYKLDLYKIWRNQQISSTLRDILYQIMIKVEEFIKANAPGSLYGEWAKKEECWSAVKVQHFDIVLSYINDDLEGNSSDVRKKVSNQETTQAEIQASIDRIFSVHQRIWEQIEDWGVSTGKLPRTLCDVASNTYSKVKNNKRNFSDIERIQSEKILDLVAENAPELFFDLDDYFLQDNQKIHSSEEITIELIQEVIKWDNQNKILKPFEYNFMNDLRNGKKVLTDRNSYIAGINIAKVKRYGF